MKARTEPFYSPPELPVKTAPSACAWSSLASLLNEKYCLYRVLHKFVVILGGHIHDAFIQRAMDIPASWRASYDHAGLTLYHSTCKGLSSRYQSPNFMSTQWRGRSRQAPVCFASIIPPRRRRTMLSRTVFTGEQCVAPADRLCLNGCYSAEVLSI